MEMTELTSLIGSIGFPIVMCLLMYKYMIESQAKVQDALNNLENAIKALEKSLETLVSITLEDRKKEK